MSCLYLYLSVEEDDSQVVNNLLSVLWASFLKMFARFVILKSVVTKKYFREICTFQHSSATPFIDEYNTDEHLDNFRYATPTQ